MKASKLLSLLPISLLVIFSAATMAGAPPPTVNEASVSLKLATQDGPGSKIFSQTLNTNGLINLLLGLPVDDKVEKNMKLVAIVPCDGELTPMFITVWDTTDAGGVAAGANYMEFDSDGSLIEVDKNENLKKSSTYAWHSTEGGSIGGFQEIDGSFSATFKQLPKQLDSTAVCISGIKSTAVTGEVLGDVVTDQDWVITGGTVKAGKPIATIDVFPPVQ